MPSLPWENNPSNVYSINSNNVHTVFLCLYIQVLEYIVISLAYLWLACYSGQWGLLVFINRIMFVFVFVSFSKLYGLFVFVFVFVLDHGIMFVFVFVSSTLTKLDEKTSLTFDNEDTSNRDYNHLVIRWLNNI